MRKLIIAIVIVTSLLGGTAGLEFAGNSILGISSPSRANAATPPADNTSAVGPFEGTETQPLFAGWNFAVWRMDGCEPVRNALGNLIESDGMNVVALFSASDQTWKLFDPTVPLELNSLTQLCKNDISALNVSAPAEWIQQSTAASEAEYSGPLSVGIEVQVANTDGGCLNVRSTPYGDVLQCLPESSVSTIDDGPVYQGGYWWWHLTDLGWSAGDYLQLMTPLPEPQPAVLAIGAQVQVTYTDGRCLNARSTPDGGAVTCLLEGSHAVIDDGPTDYADYTWWHLRDIGWVVANYIQPITTTAGSGNAFIWSIKGLITDVFGSARGANPHTGIDIDAPEGSHEPVLAAASGVVVEVSNDSGYGNYVVIDHGNGYKTKYAHLSSAATSVGRTVNQGAVIGYTGCTGWCTGEHLHFEIWKNGAPVDPLPYLPPGATFLALQNELGQP